MSRKADPSKKNDAGYYQSTYNTSKEFNKNNYDLLTVRVPKGFKNTLRQHQEEMHRQQPDNPKYKSVNAMVKALLEQETGFKVE